MARRHPTTPRQRDRRDEVRRKRKGKKFTPSQHREYAALVKAIEGNAAFIANVLLDSRDQNLKRKRPAAEPKWRYVTTKISEPV